jgi:hypothetical protein
MCLRRQQHQRSQRTDAQHDMASGDSDDAHAGCLLIARDTSTQLATFVLIPFPLRPGADVRHCVRRRWSQPGRNWQAGGDARQDGTGRTAARACLPALDNRLDHRDLHRILLCAAFLHLCPGACWGACLVINPVAFSLFNTAHGPEPRRLTAVLG